MTTDASSPARSAGIALLAFWGGLGLLDALQTVIGMRAMGMHHDWVALFAKELLAWAAWAAATPWILRLERRRSGAALRARPAATAGVHALAFAAVASVDVLWGAGLTWLLNPWTPGAPRPPFGNEVVGVAYERVLTSLVLYGGVLLAGALLASRERLARQRVEAAQLAEALAKAQLDALRHQVEPHFLFNALNAVSGLVREGDNARAVETIARISEFLRHLLDESSRQEVPLADELRFATMYLGIQQVRFAERLRVELDVAPGLERAIVPRLILQPIVENAVKHGIARRARPGAVQIGATREDARLVLTVYNDGPALAANDASMGPSIGLANVRDRLRGLHGEEAALELRDVEARGVLVSISLPYREGGEAA